MNKLTIEKMTYRDGVTWEMFEPPQWEGGELVRKPLWRVQMWRPTDTEPLWQVCHKLNWRWDDDLEDDEGNPAGEWLDGEFGKGATLALAIRGTSMKFGVSQLILNTHDLYWG